MSDNIYKILPIAVKVHETTNKIKIVGSVKQSDIISPRLFILVIEDIFKDLSQTENGINIKGEHLQNLKFADDIMIFAKDKEELTEMLTQLEK